MIKLLSLFSGIGAFEKALTRQKIPFEIVNYCEIDKYASKSYSILHNVSEDLNLQDVTKIDTSLLKDKDINLITYGFPCQDISTAGKMRGLFDENGKPTRSGLFFEALRIINDLKPNICIAENVKALCSKRFKKQFDLIISSLNDVGYNSYYDVLNATDYNLPQNRERIFIVSIRKDIDNGLFKFPDKQELKIKLQDLLSDEVDQKYYCKDEISKRYIENSALGGVELKNRLTPARFNKQPHLGEFLSITKGSLDHINNFIASTITARYYKGIGAHGDNVIIVKDL